MGSLKKKLEDPEIRKKLEEFRKQKEAKEKEDYYKDVFKNVEKDIGQDFWDTDLEDIVPDVIAPTPDISRRIREGRAAARARRRVRRTPNSILSHLGNRQDLQTSEEKEGFFEKNWVRYGVPAVLGVAASLSEIWRAFT